jgi:hypothetical protein
MNKIVILQTDNRKELPYLKLTRKANNKMCNYLNNNIKCDNVQYVYEFIDLDISKYNCKNAKYAKIFVIDDYMANTDNNIIVFLDSDAWIQNPHHLHNLILKLINDNDNVINGCFSRDPYIIVNTVINSGSFILKINEYTKEMYKTLIHNYHTINNTHWTNDQFYISNFVLKNKHKFIIFKPNILNTPNGVILRHNWWKNPKMYSDLKKIIKSHNYGNNMDHNMDHDDIIDTEVFPNIQNDYQYNDYIYDDGHWIKYNK